MSQKLNRLVANCLARHINKNKDDVILLSNKDKYYDNESPANASSYTDNIFSLMLALNEEGISSDFLGVIDQGQSFKDALDNVVDCLAVDLEKTPFSYVELGPEPIKTSYIIDKLLGKGCDLQSYTSVDINPSSSSIMREKLSLLISGEKIFNKNCDYELCTSKDFKRKGIANVFTMLGFQEGNEEPLKVAKLLQRITTIGDIVISEMQAMSTFDSSPIFEFYNNEKMKAFSKAAFKQRFCQLDSVYGFFLLPITIDAVNCFVAITTEKIISQGDYLNKTVITNYCLKYSLESFKKSREIDGSFKVIDSQVTEDETIVFQLSKRIK